MTVAHNGWRDSKHCKTGLTLIPMFGICTVLVFGVWMCYHFSVFGKGIVIFDIGGRQNAPTTGLKRIG